MKKVGKIMEEMGFRKDAPDSLKEAFVRHLIKVSTGVEVQSPSQNHGAKKPFTTQEEQLSFVFEDESISGKKAAG